MARQFIVFLAAAALSQEWQEVLGVHFTDKEMEKGMADNTMSEDQKSNPTPKTSGEQSSSARPTRPPLSKGESNLRFHVDKGHLSQAQTIIDQVHSGTKLAEALKPAKEFRKAHKDGGSNAPNLVVIFTDLEPDDVLAVAQILEWKAKTGQLHQDPIIIFCADFAHKDVGKVFDKKQLMAALTLGITDYPTLTPEGYKGDSSAHPKANGLVAKRSETVSSISDRLAAFEGDRIDLYVLAPGHGNLGAIVTQLKPKWPLKPKWRVSMYSGKFNMEGMTKSDFTALDDIMKTSDDPLVDMNKFKFFGESQKKSHACTQSLRTFSAPSFGDELFSKAPLLAAAWVLFDEEFNSELIKPSSIANKMFVGDKAEQDRFIDGPIGKLFKEHGPKAYAEQLQKDTLLWPKVPGYKRNTLNAFAEGACDSPLCDQLVFLYEWLAEEKPDYLEAKEGKWVVSEKLLTSIAPEAGSSKGDIRAIQPVLKDPLNEEMLYEIQEEMKNMVFKHLEKHSKVSESV